MLSSLQVATLLLVALGMAPAVAHALELPGKKRLSKEAYMTVQPIYYPGFTIIGGVGEFGGLLATLALLLVTPFESLAFWLTVSAFFALAAMQAIFWIFTQPVNTFWLREQQLSGAGSAFFRVRGGSSDGGGKDWKQLRDRWEYSHVARAVMSAVALGLLASAIAAS